MKALRYNEGKPKWSLIHWASLIPLVRVMEYGSSKYAKDNWKLGLKQDEILESLSRHLFALMDGESNDKESGIHHIGHILANAMMYSFTLINKKQDD